MPSDVLLFVSVSDGGLPTGVGWGGEFPKIFDFGFLALSDKLFLPIFRFKAIKRGKVMLFLVKTFSVFLINFFFLIIQKHPSNFSLATSLAFNQIFFLISRRRVVKLVC